jgi:multidrug efflux pump subunit AcrA (membrane-fusion protein)
MARLLTKLAVLALLAAPVVVLAQAGLTYRCTGKDGKKYYGSTIPKQCMGQPIEQLNKQGLVVKRMDAVGDEKERAAKAAELEKKREADVQTREESRRNRALLATYTSVKDIDQARARALAENQKTSVEVQARIEGIKKERGRLTKELEFYSGKNKPPAKLLEEIQNTEIDVKAQEELLTAKKREVATINAKYDDDKKRYLELTKPAK